MTQRMTAQELWPLIEKLPAEEQLYLAKLALRAAALGRPAAAAYRAQPPAENEFSTDDEPLAWEAEGWEHLGASG